MDYRLINKIQEDIFTPATKEDIEARVAKLQSNRVEVHSFMKRLQVALADMGIESTLSGTRNTLHIYGIANLGIADDWTWFVVGGHIEGLGEKGDTGQIATPEARDKFIANITAALEEERVFKKVQEDLFKPASKKEISARQAALQKKAEALYAKYKTIEVNDIVQITNDVEGTDLTPGTIGKVLAKQPYHPKSYCFRVKFLGLGSKFLKIEDIAKIDFEGRIQEAIDKSRLGRCYELSGRHVLNTPDFTLVHGTITRKDGYTIDHAWTEKEEQMGKFNILSVYDPVMDITLPKDAYERLLGAKEKNRYTHDELAKIVLKQKNWGPWTSR